MTWSMAMNRGLTFTGAAWDAWDERRTLYEKDRIAKLKKEYKDVEAYIVIGSKNSWLGKGGKAVFVNKAGADAWIAERETKRLEGFISNYEKERKKIVSKYEAELKALDAKLANAKKTLNEYKEMRK